MNRYYKCMFFLSLHTWRVRLTLIHSSGGRWVFRGDRVSSASVSLGDAPLMQSGICKWHLWCDSHWQTGLKYVWPEDILLEISATKWQRVIWEFWCCVFGHSTWLCYANDRGQCWEVISRFPLSLTQSLPAKTHMHGERQRKRGTKRARVKERSLQSDHSGYFPRVLSVTMEIWKKAPAA